MKNKNNRPLGAMKRDEYEIQKEAERNRKALRSEETWDIVIATLTICLWLFFLVFSIVM